MTQRKPEDHLLLQQKAKELSESLYPTIGEFAVSFEAISHAIRRGIDILLQKNGLKNNRITDILVGDLTMQPLQAVCRALLVETEKLGESEIIVLDDIFKRVSLLAEHRNRILHSSWFIDFRNPEDLRNGLLLSYKPGRTKKGAKDCPSRVAIQEIRKKGSSPLLAFKSNPSNMHPCLDHYAYRKKGSSPLLAFKSNPSNMHPCLDHYA